MSSSTHTFGKRIAGLAIAGAIVVSLGTAAHAETVSHFSQKTLDEACAKNGGSAWWDAASTNASGAEEYGCTKAHNDGSVDIISCDAQSCWHDHRPPQQINTSPTARTGIVTTSGGAKPTQTAPTAATGVLVKPAGAQTTTTTVASPTTTVPIDSRAAVRVPTGLVLAR
jgi:hypothetical protein